MVEFLFYYYCDKDAQERQTTYYMYIIDTIDIYICVLKRVETVEKEKNLSGTV